MNQQNVANTHRRTHADTSQKFANFANFPGFKIQDSRFWGKLLESRPCSKQHFYNILTVYQMEY